MRQNNLFPPSITINSNTESIKEIKLYKKSQKDFSSTRDYIYYLTHEVNNNRDESGRIYMEKDSIDGKIYANSVSTYAKDFLINIEEKIVPIVSELIKKRYLTYSSCEGHGYSFRRYIGLAFCNEEEREYVNNKIKSLKIFGVKTKLIESVSNQIISKSYIHEKNNKIKYDGKYIPENISMQKELETESFNIQFHRNYEEYKFMEIIIFDEVHFDRRFIKNPIKNLYLLFMKTFYLEKTTKKVFELIKKEFKKYPY